MTKDTKQTPQSGSDERAERLAAALRDNLKRRKAQARGRKSGESANQSGSEQD